MIPIYSTRYPRCLSPTMPSPTWPWHDHSFFNRSSSLRLWRPRWSGVINDFTKASHQPIRLSHSKTINQLCRLTRHEERISMVSLRCLFSSSCKEFTPNCLMPKDFLRSVKFSGCTMFSREEKRHWYRGVCWRICKCRSTLVHRNMNTHLYIYIS